MILALGIGATTAMFSVTETVLLKPLAYRDPSRLVTITFRVPAFSKTLSTIPANAQHYELWRDHARTFDEVALVGPDSHILSGRGEAVQLMGAHVTANLFHLLGVQPMLGRSFAADENQVGHDHVVIVSQKFWTEKLGGSAKALGESIRLDGQPFQVIGVMPALFPFPRGYDLSEVEQLSEQTDYWVPLVFSKEELANALGEENYVAIARLKAGVTNAQALANVAALEKVIAKRFPEPIEFIPIVRTLQQSMVREVKLPLLLLMGAVSAVLLIVCINLMNLTMVRAVSQRKNWAIRLAVGAREGDLLRSALIESLLLALAGGALGMWLTVWLLQLIRLGAPVELPRIDELQLDGRGLLFALLVSALSAVLFGLWPAWRATKIDPQEAMQASGRGMSQNRSSDRTGKLLVAAEVALSTLLLLSGGLLLRSLLATLAVDPAMNVDHVLTAQIDLPPDKYKNDGDIRSFYQRLDERVNAMPAVRDAGLISDIPLTGENNHNPATAGDRPSPPLSQWQMTNYRVASAHYFRAADVALKAGEVFSPGNASDTAVMISDNLAQALWPGQSAIGRPLRIYGNQHSMRVVGVVASVHASSLAQDPTLMVYFPDWRRVDRDMSLVVRTAGSPESLMPAIRKQILAIEPEAAIPHMQTIGEIVAKSVAPQRFQTMLLMAFALAALLLACLGIYGVLSFATGRRTAEIGIRMALGARPGQILRATVGSGLWPLLGGIVTGLLGSAALAKLLQSLLFQVRALDPLMYAGTAAVLLAAGGLACLIPARRAAKLDPISALRHE